MEPLWREPATAGVFLDFDGTLSSIVDEPSTARPVEGASDLLVRLGSNFGLVAVVSGRPAGFLEERLGRPPGVRMIGLYGLEEVGRDAGPCADVEARRWRPIVEAAVRDARRVAPGGVAIEHKGLGFTIHFRRAPQSRDWAHDYAAELGHRLGLAVQEARMAVELAPPGTSDKGAVVSALAARCTAVCCFGDDVGDLGAFRALDALRRGGVSVVKIAVASPEGPEELVQAADAVVEGPQGVLVVLRQLIEGVGGAQG
ncbi:MAG: trehalose-phosphatase [Acidimicrobiales bacterium]